MPFRAHPALELPIFDLDIHLKYTIRLFRDHAATHKFASGSEAAGRLSLWPSTGRPWARALCLGRLGASEPDPKNGSGDVRMSPYVLAAQPAACPDAGDGLRAQAGRSPGCFIWTSYIQCAAHRIRHRAGIFETSSV